MQAKRWCVVSDLPLQIGQIQRIEVGQVQLTDASGRQVERHWRAEAAKPDDQYSTLLEPQLSVDIDLLEQDLPAVTQQLFVTQHPAPHETES